MTDGVVHDYAFHYVPAQLIIGSLIQDLGPGVGLRGCMDACSQQTSCILIRVTGSSLSAAMDSCQLFAYDTDTDFVSVYRVDGSRLYHDGFTSSISTASIQSATAGMLLEGTAASNGAARCCCHRIWSRSTKRGSNHGSRLIASGQTALIMLEVHEWKAWQTGSYVARVTAGYPAVLPASLSWSCAAACPALPCLHAN